MATVYMICLGMSLSGALIHINESFMRMDSRVILLLGLKDVQRAIVNADANRERRVVRGGSWSFNAKSVRVANRLAEKPSLLSSDVGFRCVRAVKPKK